MDATDFLLTPAMNEVLRGGGHMINVVDSPFEVVNKTRAMVMALVLASIDVTVNHFVLSL